MKGIKYFRVFGVLLFNMALAGSSFSQTSDQCIAAANQLYAAKQYEKAVLVYQQATQINPHSEAAFQGEGNCDYLLGWDSEALTAYEAALSLNPNNLPVAKVIEKLKARLENSGSSPSASAAGSPGQADSNATKAIGYSMLLHFQGGAAAGTNNPFDLGFGGGLGADFALNHDLFLGGNLSFYTFNATSPINQTVLKVSANLIESTGEATVDLKLRLGNGGVHPYFMAGGGISYLITGANLMGTNKGNLYQGSVPSLNQVQAVALLGAGIEFLLEEDMGLFLQSRYDVVFTDPGSSSLTAVSTVLTATGGIFGQVPIEMGLSLDI